MVWSDLARSAIALLLAALVAAMTIGIGVPTIAAAILGALAAAMALMPLRAKPPPAPPAPPDPPSPGIGELIDAISDPLLRIERQTVTHANAAARDLLGQHIVGGDVRLAIRHPAAAERLLGLPTPPGDGPPPSVELVGLGTHERRWEMAVRDLPDGSRLARLTDRTGAYAVERIRVDFVANASHELRTPLATLLGFIETLEEAGDDAATRARFLKIMFGEAKRMQRLVEDLMSLSRIEADKYSLPREAVELPGLIDEVRDALRTGLVRDAERIVIGVGDGIRPVAGDRAQLSQLLHNLIGNAAKYGRAGGPIHISLAPARAGMIRIVVEDEGDGIPPEHLPRLTERFYRVDPSRSRSLGGTGLGLAIVKHIVERHRGRLDIFSEPGKGTRVSVLLPIAAAG
ncbi:MAG: two-component system phosphate regulon sensor histidine kinase PhoR [Sphingomonas bacterium]|nr:two-component system phosphate regulon sensor histidine kinase PhoR [Sphingomonas bacterium]